MRMIPKNEAAGVGALRARGLRLTTPRRLILEVVRNTDVHPTAAFVYARVRRQLPRVSLATVYRNLRRLAAEGVLVERADEAGIRFDANLARHDHFTCLACHRIYDVPAPARRRPFRAVVPRTGFEVLEQRTEYYGRCAACRRRAATRVTATGDRVIARGDNVTVNGDTATAPVARATAQRRTLHGRT